MAQTLVSIRDLSVRYRSRDEAAYALDQVSFDVERGQVFALVGESGSGKTTIGMSIINLLPDEADILGGEVWFGDQNVLTLDERSLREIRGRRVTMIFQDPVAGLNPVISVGDQVGEMLTNHLNWRKKEAREAAIEILAGVGLADPKRVAKSYPFQLSGGMCQRVMIGIATALKPDLIVADEPTAALDVTVQAQILHHTPTASSPPAPASTPSARSSTPSPAPPPTSTSQPTTAPSSPAVARPCSSAATSVRPSSPPSRASPAAASPATTPSGRGEDG